MTGNELFDITEQQLGLAHPEIMIAARIFDIFGTLNLLCQLSTQSNRDLSIGPPMQDKRGFQDTKRFGSAHVAGLNMLRCDGSVDFINYDVEAAVFKAAGNRLGP